MPGTVHLLVGAALAALIPSLPMMVVASFFSHYLLDFLPHIDPETFADEEHPYTWWQRGTLIADISLVVIFLVALYWLRSEPLDYLLGATVAQIPDLLTPLERYPLFMPLRRVHEMFHWDKTRARWWSWYIPALVIPVIMSLLALSVIWNRLNM